MLKSKVGMPPVQFSGQKIDLRAQARRARQRLYPVTIFYTACSLSVVWLALRSRAPAATVLGFYLAGCAAWTLVEYLVHRYVLHFVFPAGRGIVQHWLHRTFDHLHAEHHARPWDGDHINGTIRDTWLVMALFGALSFLAPLHTVPVFWAAVMQAYVVEEWVHQSTHYPTVYGLRGPYWSYITSHHTYHHSPRGSEVAYGLTSGYWDLVFGTRIPALDRRLLSAARSGRPAPAVSAE